MYIMKFNGHIFFISLVVSLVSSFVTPSFKIISANRAMVRGASALPDDRSIFKSFKALVFGVKATEQFRNIGFTTENELIEFGVRNFADTDSLLGLRNTFASFVALNTSLSVVELTIALGKLEPLIRARYAKAATKADIAAIEAAAKDFSAKSLSSFLKRVALYSAPKVIEFDEANNYLVYQERSNSETKYFIGLKTIMKASRAVQNWQKSGTQSKMVIRICGLPKSGKTTAGSVVFGAALDHLCGDINEQKGFFWRKVKKTKMLYVDLLLLVSEDSIKGKLKLLCDSLGVPKYGRSSSQWDLQKRLEDYTLALPMGSIIFLDEIQGLIEGLSFRDAEYLSTWLRNWMISFPSRVQFVVSGSSTPTLLYSLIRAFQNGISFFLGTDSEISTSVDAEDEKVNIPTFQRLVQKYHPAQQNLVSDIISNYSDILSQVRNYLRPSDLNMLRRGEFSTPILLFERIKRIYTRDFLPIVRRDYSIHGSLIALAYAEKQGMRRPDIFEDTDCLFSEMLLEFFPRDDYGVAAFSEVNLNIT